MKIEEIVAAVRARRKLLGLDQKELAELSGVSVHAIINLETGKGAPTLRTLDAVCRILGYQIELSLKRPKG